MVRLATMVKENLAYPQEEPRIESLHLSDLEGIRFAAGTKPVSIPEGSIEEKEINSVADRRSMERRSGANQNQDIRKNYSKAGDYLRHVWTNIAGNQPVPIEAGLAIIDDILDLPNLNNMYELTIRYDNDKDYRIYHSLNTMIYALIVGQNLGYQHTKLIELGIAALLHDVGMFKIPDPIVDKQKALTNDELVWIKRHPAIGENVLLSSKRNIPSQNIVAAVYQHHERENGGGYTEGIKGDKINEYAGIIGISDSYESMTHSRPHKKAILQCASMKELIKSKNTLFSTKIIRAFLEAISLYPIGSCVRLNNNAVGTVMAVNKAHPLKPLIKLLLDGHGNRIMEDKLINLSDNSILSIADGVSEMKFNS